MRAERLRMLILPSPQHAHGELPSGSASIRTGDWAQVQFYRFGTSTEFVICQSCRVYIGAIEETAAGTHAVPPTGPGGNPPLIVAFLIFRGKHLCAGCRDKQGPEKRHREPCPPMIRRRSGSVRLDPATYSVVFPQRNRSFANSSLEQTQFKPLSLSGIGPARVVQMTGTHATRSERPYSHCGTTSSNPFPPAGSRANHRFLSGGATS